MRNLILVLITAFASACHSAGYTAPPASTSGTAAAATSTGEPWTWPIEVAEVIVDIPTGAKVGRNHGISPLSDNVAELALDLTVPKNTWVWGKNVVFEHASLRREAIAQLRSVRYDVVEKDGTLRLEGRIHSLAYDTRDDLALAHVGVEWTLRDVASGSALWTGKQEAKTKTAGASAAVIATATRHTLMRASGDPKFREIVRKPKGTPAASGPAAAPTSTPDAAPATNATPEPAPAATATPAPN